ncbi:MAG: GntR family transcriptional regulator [Synergistaceae bacterium]|nr:GntR family transcriptional regulator [Synergistaceae bacterium]
MDQIKKAFPIRIEITSALKKAIFAHEYSHGDELNLTEIAEQLGVSRTPVREAFQTLAEEGFITLRMNKGAVVNKIGRKFVQDSFEMRILLESEAACRACVNRMVIEDLMPRAILQRDFAGMVSREDYEKLNGDIHMRIWNSADNDRLKHYLLELWNGPSTGQSVDESSAHYRASTLEHIEILEAIRDNEPDKARDAMRRHITRSMNNILQKYPE